MLLAVQVCRTEVLFDLKLLSNRYRSDGFEVGGALDQGRATIGPLIVELVLCLKGGYRHGFAVLLLSALLCLGTLVVARILHPRPDELEKKSAHFLETKRLPKGYWMYVAAGAFIAAGFADFALIAFHFQKAAIVSQNLIPIFYSVAMGTGAIGSLVLGRFLDRIGLPILILAFFVSACPLPFCFSEAQGLPWSG